MAQIMSTVSEGLAVLTPAGGMVDARASPAVWFPDLPSVEWISIGIGTLAGLSVGLVIGWIACARLSAQAPVVPTTMTRLALLAFYICVAGAAALSSAQMPLSKATVLIVTGSVAIVAAMRAVSMFGTGEAIELESDWGGLGGGLGGWRLSPATSLTLVAVLFAAGAITVMLPPGTAPTTLESAEAKPTPGGKGISPKDDEKKSAGVPENGASEQALENKHALENKSAPKNEPAPEK